MEVYLSSMINDNEDPAEMEYELEATTAFEVGTTCGPNPSKKKKKNKMVKARGPDFSRFEDILLVKSWLATTMDPISGTEKKKNTYWEKFSKEYHKQKEATVPKDSRQIMGNKWEKARVSREAMATKMSTTWTGILSAREKKNKKRYNLMLDVQKERMEWDRTGAEKRLEMKREKIELEK
ncbi:hypothetical protein D1007_25390 [Hordeum vulgare]|nr:hypothetical protein D1007_25390 [Hordeum vulgare]